MSALVIKRARRLVLPEAHIDRVMAVVPEARRHCVQGHPFVAVHHGLDETRVLNNIGIPAPSPILHYYDWPGRFQPFAHQKQTAAFLTLHKRALVLSEIGTGKTNAALWAADYLMAVGAVKRVLVLAPLSTLERTWGDSVFQTFTDRQFVVLHGSRRVRCARAEQDVDFYLCNHDGFSIVGARLLNKVDLLIVDEAAEYRNTSTLRFRALYGWTRMRKGLRIWLMTGTPTPNAPTDAFGLAKMVDNPHLPPSVWAFKEQTMRKVSQFKWVARDEAGEIVHRVLQPAVRHIRSECFDLPDTVFETHHVDLTPTQRTHYDKMFKDFVTDVGSGVPVTAVNEAVQIGKLIQIACGVVYDREGGATVLDCGPRVLVTKEVIAAAGAKVIVFVPLIGVLKMLYAELAKHWTVAVVSGDVPASQRNIIFRDFQVSSDPHILLAHPETMAHGLTLTAASTIIWYGPVHSNETYTQANGRIERPGKKNNSLVVHIESTPVEREIYSRLQHKQKVQGVLLDLIHKETGAHGTNS